MWLATHLVLVQVCGNSISWWPPHFTCFCLLDKGKHYTHQLHISYPPSPIAWVKSTHISQHSRGAAHGWGFPWLKLVCRRRWCREERRCLLMGRYARCLGQWSLLQGVGPEGGTQLGCTRRHCLRPGWTTGVWSWTWWWCTQLDDGGKQCEMSKHMHIVHADMCIISRPLLHRQHVAWQPQ